MNAKMLQSQAIEAIKKRKPYQDTWTIGYLTRGGSYIIASNGRQSDSQKPRDLVIVLPADIGNGRAIPIWITTNPDLITEIEAALAD